MRERVWLMAVLVAMGAGWGSTQVLSKIVVSEGYRHLGVVFWQLVLSGGILGAISLIRGKGLPVERRHLGLYLIIALVGTVLPNSASYEAARHLPAGILSLVLATVPMFAFPIALAWGIDRFSLARLAGLLIGLVGVALIALPEASLPDPAMVLFLPLALLGPFFYGIEGNYVARYGTEGLDPVQVLFGASVIGACIAGPVAVATGSWVSPFPPWGAPDYALMITSVIHAMVYSTYVWLVGRAGAVFASQVSYLVTGFGIVWAILLLGESYSGFVWGALALMFLGLFLVQPRRRAPLAPDAPLGETGRQA